MQWRYHMARAVEQRNRCMHVDPKAGGTITPVRTHVLKRVCLIMCAYAYFMMSTS